MSVYACSDFHGYKSVYDKICKDLSKEDRVFFLGDAGDRGPQSWELIKEIYQNPQFIYLLGNHEDMLVDAMEEYLDKHTINESLELLKYNGGKDTFRGWLQETEQEREKWYNKLSRLSVIEEYINKNGFKIILSHAGYTPYQTIRPVKKNLIWDRKHLNDEWPIEAEDIIVIHGHTPVEYPPMFYADNHKIDIDCGTFKTGKTCLIDLNTLESKVYTI